MAAETTYYKLRGARNTLNAAPNYDGNTQGGNMKNSIYPKACLAFIGTFIGAISAAQAADFDDTARVVRVAPHV